MRACLNSSGRFSGASGFAGCALCSSRGRKLDADLASVHDRDGHLALACCATRRRKQPERPASYEAGLDLLRQRPSESSVPRSLGLQQAS